MNDTKTTPKSTAHSRLIGIPVHVAGSVDKHGNVRHAHTRIQQVKVDSGIGGTARFNQALTMATQAHNGQIRKGTENAQGIATPYITHPVAVAALVVRYGGDEDQAIAGLLHDVLEDGGPKWAEPIRAQFGARVLSMVQACTDGVPDATGQKPPWKQRKESYLAHLAESSGDALLVSACDKLHNLSCIVSDLRELGDAVFDRFTASKDQTIWYYTELARVLVGRVPERLGRAIRAELLELNGLAKA